ncbi:MAG TPA: hypothetical protein VJG83_04785 [archaeon]|nr:hypothetical protein [archaeon]
MALGILRNFVKARFDNPNILLALIFLLLPFALLVAVRALFGISIQPLDIAIGALREIIYFILASILMYILLVVFKGRNVRGKFSSIVSAFSTTYLITFIFSALCLLVVHIAVPGFFAKIATLQGQNVTFEQMLSVVSSLALPSESVLLALTIVMVLLGFFALFSGAYVIYKIGKLVDEHNSFSNSVFVVVFAVLSFVLSNLVAFAFSLFL